MHGAIVKAVKTREPAAGPAGGPAGPTGRMLLSRRSGEERAQRRQGLFADAEVRPAAALLALDEARLEEDFRWWLTVGWLRPSGSVRWQTHASWPGWAWIRLSRRSREGSAIAFSAAASCSASPGSSGAWSSGGRRGRWWRSFTRIHIDRDR